jgi:uncharacterized protein (DUF1330 family)
MSECVVKFNSTANSLSKLEFKDIAKIMDIVSCCDKKLSAIKAFKDNHNMAAIYPIETRSIGEHWFNYDKLTSKLTVSVVERADSLKVNFFRNDHTSTLNSQDRLQFYESYFESYRDLKYIVLISSHLDSVILDINQIKEEPEKHVRRELGNFFKELSTMVADLFPVEEKEHYKWFNIFYDNLVCFSDRFKDQVLETEARDYICKIDNAMFALGSKLREKIIKLPVSNSSMETHRDSLIEMKDMAVELFPYQRKLNEMIDQALNNIVLKSPGSIAKLGLLLSQSNNSVGKMLLEHAAFEDYQTVLRNKKTLTFSVENTLDVMKRESVASSIDSVMLKKLHDLWHERYWNLVEEGYLKDDAPQQKRCLEDLVIRAYRKIKSPTQMPSVKVLAYVFAYWTLSKLYSKPRVSMVETSQEVAAAQQQTLNREELLQPHAAQIIAILRLLGLDTGSMVNHLAQVKTGEGKSVTLAVASIVLAMHGCIVDCACYSQYLSDRDYSAFSGLFTAFRVQDKIKYGTFNAICEKFLNREMDIRSEVERLIMSDRFQGTGTAARRQSNRSILLIDEVDVFLSKDFYGSMYRPLAQVKHANITALINFLWENRNSISFRALLNDSLYVACINTFPAAWRQLIEECIKSLFYDLRTFDSHQYVVLDGKIGYRDQDGISFTLNYGYKTMFAYFKEVQDGNLPKSALENIAYLQINCGVFAYSEIPKLYSNVLGVSGTLDTLTRKENEILSNIYKIATFTYIPSVYGQNQRVFRGDHNEDVIIESERGNYINAICNEITARLQGSNGGKRAVLVFFQSKEHLDEFYNSPSVQRKAMTILSEETRHTQKEAIVQRTATQGAITLLTRAFGRGTDFICYDDQIQQNGGVHVIQTFVSPLVSEEVQIMGRTARQGNKGSFGMVLHATDLEPFGITKQIVDSMFNEGKRYTVIAEYRNAAFEKLFPDNMKFVDEIREQHDKSLRFKTLLVSQKNLEGIRGFLVDSNTRIGMDIDVLNGETQRTLCLMDATGSMSNLLEKAKNTVHLMFERAFQILKSNNIKTPFEVQFAVYRNYSSGPSKIFLASPWATNASDIRTFMNTIHPNGGQGNEAVEIALNYANRAHTQDPLTQVLLIGDMPPNTRDEVTIKRQGASFNWSTSLYARSTYYVDEVRKLKANRVPVHSFYLTNHAASAFQEIAAETKGTSTFLDLDKENGAEILTAVVARTILAAAGKNKDVREKLLSDYDRTYGFSGYVA